MLDGVGFAPGRIVKPVNVRQWVELPDFRPVVARISSSSAPSEAPEIRRRLADVVMPEPALNRRERHAGIHPPRARLAPQIVKVQIDRAVGRQRFGSELILFTLDPLRLVAVCLENEGLPRFLNRTDPPAYSVAEEVSAVRRLLLL